LTQEDFAMEYPIKERAIICLLSNPSPAAYMNIYEEGDIWIKIQGCEACSPENRKKCCGNCGMFSQVKGCVWHLETPIANSSKPWNCVVKPYPDSAMPFCALEFRCVKGSNLGKVRRVKDRGDVFV